MSAERAGHVVFGCMHACRDLAVPGLVSLPCVGRLDLASLLLVFARGGAGALVLACPAGECRHRGGACDDLATALVVRAREAIGRAGLAPSRLGLRRLRAGEPAAEAAAEHAAAVAALPEWRRVVTEVPTGTEGAMPAELALRLSAGIEARSGYAGSVEGEGRVLLWPGCLETRGALVGSEQPAGRARALARLAGIEPALSSPRCCGAPLRAAGPSGAEAFTALALANAALVARSGAELVLTACPSCARTMREGYAEVGARLEAEVRDLPGFAAERLELSGSEAAVFVAGRGPGSPAGLAGLAAPAGDWTGWGELRGPALRRAVVELAREAERRGASAAVVPSSHDAALAGAIQARAAWRSGPAVAILDPIAALLRFGTAAHPRPGEPEGSDHG